MAAIAILRQDTTAALGSVSPAFATKSPFRGCRSRIAHCCWKNSKTGRWPAKIYRDLVQQDPSNLDNRLKLAQFYFFSKDTAKAGEEFGPRCSGSFPNEERCDFGPCGIRQNGSGYPRCCVDLPPGIGTKPRVFLPSAGCCAICLVQPIAMTTPLHCINP